MSNAPPTSVLVKYDTRPLIIVRCSYTRSLDLNGVLDWYAKEYGFEREKLDAINIDEVTHPSAVPASATAVEVTEGVAPIAALNALAADWDDKAQGLYAASEKERDAETAKTQRVMKAVYRQAAEDLRAALAAGLGNGRRG
jgi:hypothetical protein